MSARRLQGHGWPGHPQSFAPAKGFALVITLTLMILLTVIAVGLLTLSSISLRNSSRAMLEQEARQNARLALMIAIGELQSATGPDQRTTASAGVTANAPARPRLTGVWEGWKWDGAGPVPNFQSERNDRFVRWLVSTLDSTEAESLDYAATELTGERISLVGRGTDPLDEVSANVIPNSGGRGDSQGFAWAVFDESTKVPTALPEPEGDSLAVLQHRMSEAPLPGYASATSRNNPHFPASSLRRLLRRGYEGQEGYDRQAGPSQWLFQGPPAESKFHHSNHSAHARRNFRSDQAPSSQALPISQNHPKWGVTPRQLPS